MSNTLFSFIKNQVDIVDVISQYVALTPLGYYYKGLSPFKSEKTPSFTVTPDKKIFYCFSTNQGGDVIDFVSKIENCSQFEAALILAEKYNVSLPSHTYKKSDYQSEKHNQYYFKTYKLFLDWTNKSLQSNTLGLNFLKERGISSESISKYSLGYCPGGKQFQQFLLDSRKNGILIEDFLRSGILQKKNYCSFSERIIFPIDNYLGMWCGCGGRILDGDSIHAKYINSQQTEEFSKKKLLYGFSQARESIKKTKTVYLAEGYIDVILMSQHGYQNTIGTMGTALTKEHIDFIKRFVNKIILIYDGDKAGQNAIKKAIYLLWNELIDVEVIILPEKEDPASLCQKGIIEECIKKKISAIDFFINYQRKDLQEDKSLKNQYEHFKELREIIQRIDDSDKRNSLLLKISKELDIPPAFLYKKLNKELNHKNIESQATAKKMEENKTLFILLFYFSVLSFDEEYCNIQEIKNILELNKYIDLVDIIKKYEMSYEKNFLEYMKIEYPHIYNHILKINARYIFNKRNYDILYKKIIEISWRKYHKNNVKLSSKTFLDFIKQKI